MKITILTLFPEMFDSFFNNSIIKRAVDKNIVEFEFKNIREYTLDKHHRVDNPPVGGGAGLIMMCQPIIDCLEDIKKENSKILLTSPKGQTFNQKKAIELSKDEHLIFICGHYEGIDSRIENYIDEEISIGDFILTGGEVAVMTMVDSIVRLLPDAISSSSIEEETFNDGLEYPQFTLPFDYQGHKIPDILFSGNHTAIKKWRRKQSLILTREKRPDLFANMQLSKEDLLLINEYDNNITPKWETDALTKGKKYLKK